MLGFVQKDFTFSWHLPPHIGFSLHQSQITFHCLGRDDVMGLLDVCRCLSLHPRTCMVPDTIPNRIGRVSVLRFLGRYSYGIYIWHQLPSPICIFWASLVRAHIISTSGTDGLCNGDAGTLYGTGRAKLPLP